MGGIVDSVVGVFVEDVEDGDQHGSAQLAI
jgi:hypothetical protein